MGNAVRAYLELLNKIDPFFVKANSLSVWNNALSGVSEDEVSFKQFFFGRQLDLNFRIIYRNAQMVFGTDDTCMFELSPGARTYAYEKLGSWVNPQFRETEGKLYYETAQCNWQTSVLNQAGFKATYSYCWGSTTCYRPIRQKYYTAAELTAKEAAEEKKRREDEILKKAQEQNAYYYGGYNNNNYYYGNYYEAAAATLSHTNGYYSGKDYALPTNMENEAELEIEMEDE